MSTEVSQLAHANGGGAHPRSCCRPDSGVGSGVEPGPAEGVPHPLLTVDELALLLRVERKTVYDAIARGEMPGVRRIGRLIRISRSAVVAWLAEGQGRVSRSGKNR